MGKSSRWCFSNVPNIGLLSKALFLLLFHVLGASSSYSRQQQPSTYCQGEERIALLQFKQNFIIDPSASSDDGSYPKVSSWKPAEGNQNTNCCSWDGVECDGDTGHVTGLDLSSSCLYGSINSSSSLFRLVHLRRLNLADNHFNYSQIPTTIRNLSRLRYLNLSFSVFSGQVPYEISQLSKLSSLDLSYNRDTLSGEGLMKLKVPNLADLVQNLTSLKKLHLSYINISSTIPASISNLSFLLSLALRNCDLYGEFPVRIFRLHYLTYLSVAFNQQLSGYLPDFNGSSPLTLLSLRGTNFSKALPKSIRGLDALNQLDLAECSFSGPIPASLANLTKLNYLSLAMNNFVGGPLSWLGKQTRLSVLDLRSINLSGRIPSSLRNLTQLTYLSLPNNQLTGPIPSLLGNLSRLSYLDLSVNSLSGSIPESLFSLMDLYYLDLYGNDLHGTFDICKLQSSITDLHVGWNKLEVPHCEIRNTTLLPKLLFLQLDDCNIQEFPDFLRHQQNLIWLSLFNNKLHGQIPKWMWNTSTQSLEFLDLEFNFLSGFGQPPNVVLPWVNLQVLFAGDNLLDGSPPILPQNIIYCSLRDNKLNGELSPLMCNLSTLQYLTLSNNKMSSTIPPCLGNFSDVLQVIDLRNNSFHGMLPQTYSNTSNLKILDVSYNQLLGYIPRSLVNCVKLESLVLSVNKFSDVFPFWLGSLPQLKLLAMHYNQFYGVIENTKVNHFPELRILDLSYNNFSGEFPSEYIFSSNAMRGIVLSQPSYMEASSDLNISGAGPTFAYSFRVTISNKGVERYYDSIREDLGVVDISTNNFHGKIPQFIGNLKGLRFLNISNNIFNGSIPSVLGNLTSLEALDLSQNQLSGQIPQQLAELTSLANFDVSYNNLTGSIPQGRQFYTFENSSFVGNPGLCGDPLTKRCGNSKLPPSSSIEENNSGFAFEFDWKFVLAGVASGLVVGVVLADVVITRKRELFLDVVGMIIRQMKRIRRQRTERRH